MRVRKVKKKARAKNKRKNQRAEYNLRNNTTFISDLW